MEIIQLVSFYQIVKTGSFSKASNVVLRSQSAVSHQIRNLENELKIKLFERLRKKVKLTEEGKILFDVVNAFFIDLEKLKGIYDDMQHGKGGSLTIATSSAPITYFLPDVIKKFIDQCSRIKFKLINCSLTSEILSMVLEGEADFGIGPKSNKVLPEKMNFMFWKSFDIVLLAAKGHPISKKKVIKLDDISKYPLVLYREGTVVRRVIEEVFIKNKLYYEVIMEMDVAENIKKYVEMGMGVSILSSLTLTHTDKGRFFFSNINNLFGRIDYGLYFRKNKYITAAMKQFINYFAPDLLNNLPCHLV